jgi:adenylate cyclase class IV
MQNIEFKSELRDVELARSLLRKIQAVWVETLVQTDTYYRLADGRLKKRETVGHPTEWIFYHRADEARARVSRFTIYSEAQARQQFGTTEPPIWVVVKKTREVYLHLGVRIHIDCVEGLGHGAPAGGGVGGIGTGGCGWFLELEALVTPRQTAEKAERAVHMLRQALQPVLGEMLSLGYSDMLDSEGNQGRKSA